MRARTGLIGRDAEQHELETVIGAAAAGVPAALIVGGEAGVGKTRLVAEVTSAALERHGVRTLWGRCLRFGAAESPYQPVGQLLTEWFRQAGGDERERVMQGLPIARLATIAPILGDPSWDEPGPLIPVVAVMLERISGVTPTVIVVDDLQWADTTSLDLLAFVLAGFGTGQHCGVVGTYRDSDLHQGHRLHGWLADMRRLPGVAELHLDPLGLAGTEQLVAALCGDEGAVARGAKVFARSRGNPYLSELLALAPEGDELGAGLRDALLAAWHRLTGPAREVAQMLAVGGRPVDLPVLEQITAIKGLTREETNECVTEIAVAGIATVSATWEVWFRHPLIAELLVSTMSPSDLEELHSTYAVVWARATSATASARAAHLALHHDGAHHVEDAFDWSLRAADAAAELLAWSEECEHLCRACRLWPQVTPAQRGSDADRVLLLGRASDSAIRAGEYHVALDLREDALRLVDRRRHPRDAARLHIHLDQLRRWCGIHVMPSVDSDMLALTAQIPDTPERAIAVAQLAPSEVWAGDPAAADHVSEAFRVARRTDSDEAMGWVLGVRSQTRWGTPEGLVDAEWALVRAKASGDRVLLVVTANFWSNCLEGLGRLAVSTDRMLELFREVMSSGSFYEAVELLPGIASDLVDLGRWSEASSVIREGLSRRVTSSRGGDLRIIAADLAARKGDIAAARQHVVRARELSPRRRLVGGFAVAGEARVAIALGDQVQALSVMAEAIAHMRSVDKDRADELLVWAARAAADLAAKPGQHDHAVAWLEHVVELRGETPPLFVATTAENPFPSAWGHLFAAEAARCHDGGPGRPALWAEAITACAAAGMAWDQALCSLRLAQSLLLAMGNRGRAASALRDAARIAGRLGAAPILADVESLARQSRISLSEPVRSDRSAGPQPGFEVTDEDAEAPQQPGADRTARESARDLEPAGMPALTPRQWSVLRLVATGATNARIAHQLGLSEGTVRKHLENTFERLGVTSRAPAVSRVSAWL